MACAHDRLNSISNRCIVKWYRFELNLHFSIDSVESSHGRNSKVHHYRWTCNGFKRKQVRSVLMLQANFIQKVSIFCDYFCFFSSLWFPFRFVPIRIVWLDLLISLILCDNLKKKINTLFWKIIMISFRFRSIQKRNPKYFYPSVFKSGIAFSFNSFLK